MQKTPFKPVDVPYVILKKITSSLVLLFLLFTFPLFAKSNSFGNEDNSNIIISGDATIFESEDSLNDKIPNRDSEEIAKQEAVIFVSEGVSIYNIEAFKNAKVINLEKTNKPRKLAKKKIDKKATFAKIQIKDIKIKPESTYYHSTKNSDVFSQSSKKEIFFSPNSGQSFSAIVHVIKLVNRKLHPFSKQSFTYTNPSIRVCYFSGKHSVRPPNSFA